MSNVRWSIVVPEETDRALRSYLARRGTKKGDISRFVEEVVQARLFEFLPWSRRISAAGSMGWPRCAGNGSGKTRWAARSLSFATAGGPR